LRTSTLRSESSRPYRRRSTRSGAAMASLRESTIEFVEVGENKGEAAQGVTELYRRERARPAGWRGGEPDPLT
jgi:hypothetical protein